jgi:hypothetical protein
VSTNVEPQSAFIRAEIAQLRQSRRWTDSQYRLSVVTSLIAFALSGAPFPSTAVMLPLLSLFLLGFWTLGEARYREAEDRAVSLLFNLEHRDSDSDGRSRTMEQDIATYLDNWIRTRAKLTSVERSGYGILIAVEIGVAAARVIAA